MAKYICCNQNECGCGYRHKKAETAPSSCTVDSIVGRDPVVNLIVEWMLSDLANTDCGGEFLAPDEDVNETCAGCPHYQVCAANNEKRNALRIAANAGGEALT